MEILLVNSDDAFFAEEPEEIELPEHSKRLKKRPERRFMTSAQLESVVEQLDSYLEYVLSDLDRYARNIVKFRIGYYGRIYSHKEISKIIGYTAQNVRVAERKAIAKLRNVEDYDTMLKIVSGWSEEITGAVEMAKIEIKKTEEPG